MGILDLIFWKKEDGNKSVIQEEPTCDNPCDYCGKERLGHQKQRKFHSKKYHVKCFRKLKKDANKEAFGL